MNLNKQKANAFTLIELLTIIAVIGILAGILIPLAGGVIRQSRIAASKSQLWQYVTAIEQFKAEYGYYPTIFGNTENSYSLEGAVNSIDFIETLSGRDVASGANIVEGGNRNSIQFHNFSDTECFVNNNNAVQQHQLADRFNNTGIFFLVDRNGDGYVNPIIPNNRDPDPPVNPLRTGVTAWVVEDQNDNMPGYGLW